jgi:hypothetical protein
LDEQIHFFQTIAPIDSPFGVSQDREGGVERFAVAPGAFQRIPQDDKHFRAGSAKLRLESPQLGDMRSALHSVILADEEQDYINFSTVVPQPNLAAGAGWQVKIRSWVAYTKFTNIS